MAQRRRKPVSRARKKPARSAGRRTSRKKSRKNKIRLFFTVLVLGLIAIWIWKPQLYVISSDFIRQTYNTLTDKRDSRGVPIVPPVVMRTHNNYAADIDKLSAQFNLSPEYLKSLIILECSGQKDVKPRYEKHIYRYLLNVREKKLNKFENITYSHLQDATDEALKNMARSWGPFQIMGYKCILLDIQLKDLRGENALYWGVKWIDMTYGDYIRKGRYKDAFHIHNTGDTYPVVGPPKTYDPKYVQNGLMYMKYFSAYRPEIGSI